MKKKFKLDKCFGSYTNPIDLFNKWFAYAKRHEINDHNALALGTADKNGKPSVRMVLLKDYNDKGFTFYTNLKSKKSSDLKDNPYASMCFHWKSCLRQIRIVGKISKVPDKEADKYFYSRPYDSKIGAWASNQSHKLNTRKQLYKEIIFYNKKFKNYKIIPRPSFWSGWKLYPKEIEFWLDGKNRIHERLKYIRKNNRWKKFLLNP